MKKNALILAAGCGSRMKSEKSKVLFEILDKPMISCVYDNLKNAGIERIIPIISPDRREVLDPLVNDVEYVLQHETNGTGHAVMQAKALLENENGLTIIVAGDQPLINDYDISQLIKYHTTNGCDLTMMTAILHDPTGYGRVIKNGFQVERIVEQKDLSSGEYHLNEVNISTYCFDNKLLFECINEIDNKNRQNEYYLTDLVEIFNQKGLRIGSMPISNNEFSIGVNDLISLSHANDIMRKHVNFKHMAAGVEIIDPANTSIGYDVKIGSNTTIYPGSIIMGDTEIGSHCKIMTSYIYDSKIGNNVSVGPYAHVRQNAVIEDRCRIGNFVEVKKSHLKAGVKSAHLSYLGDSEIGEATNIGCGVITANYDGKNKHKTVIGKNSFIGCNTNLVAPINIGNDVLVAAGSTVTKDIDDEALVIARSREVIKDKYNKK